ncbi:hypothetical protein [Aliiglaciecola lipolytica]|uniref:Transmembrane protein n=1 Tax=Aliiglaciecola lipolytica E3 TaxID=1127673 RepID=K6X7B9_9ALTE|nr:hypothetical protein [Aliiglaciecola lipolytica]GAC16509.1 hypothetical protein GLIP_3898 [Aliiglaciecola lipolytica E3]
MNTATLLMNQKTTSSQSILWLKHGLSLCLKAPFKIFFLLLATIIIEGLFQLLPAPIGVITSKLVMVMLIASLWPVLDQISKHRTFTFKSLRLYTGWSKLPLLSLFMLLPTVAQVLTAIGLLGSSGIDLLLYAQMVDVTPVQLSIIFASATPVSILLMFVPAYLLLDNKNVQTAIGNGVRLVLRAWKPLTVVFAINLLAIIAVPFTFLLSALLLGPLLLCINYVAFIDLTQNQ